MSRNKEDEGKLDILDTSLGYSIGWYFEEEDEFGLMLGESWPEQNEKPSSDPELQKVREIENAVQKIGYPERRGSSAFYWESLTLAKRALACARRMEKAFKVDRPLPDWALEAIAHGWKPPKGWKP